MARIERNWEAEVAGQASPQIHPLVAGVGRLIDAAMILLVEHVWLRGVLHHSVQALPELRVLLGREVGAGALVREGPRAPPSSVRMQPTAEMPTHMRAGSA